ncbi:OmpA family protein [Sedimentimonas flavescens]|uniref:OmpA family protein n=1 Tax=Sedimentimonas flavescens TaxID=2851012 RepID=UPI001C4A2D89|nr:OmpA family protein [Sedimentimonas flavescens]MBW0159292.1 OmpA family protein [Sedimentimonas flavescens]
MIKNKLDSTTALVLVLSFLQPLPALAQSKAETPGAIPEAMLASTLACLENFSGKPKAAEEACLEELKFTGVVCDPSLLEVDDAADKKDKKNRGESNEIMAERIVRAANAEACSIEQAAVDAVKATEDAQVAADAKAKTDAEALASAETEKVTDAEAAADLKAQEAADAELKAKDQTDAKAQEDADAAALAAAKAEAEAADKAAKAEAKAAKAAEAEARADAKTKSEAETTAIADAKALAQVKKAEETAIAENEARAAAQAKECVVELLDAKGETLCADDMSQAEIAVVTAEATDGADIEVTTQTVTEEATRSSSEEFVEPKVKSKDGGLSTLEKAGLLALGALVVGSVLSNGQKVTAKTGDRVVVQDQYGNFSVLKDDDILVREAGSDVRTETFNDGSTRTFVTRQDGVQIVTIRDVMGRVLRRTRIDSNGTEVMLIDDTRRFEPVEIQALPKPTVSDLSYRDATDKDTLREALRAAERRDLGRAFSLSQVREYREVRDLAPEINLSNITFRTASAAIEPSEAEQLLEIGSLMVELINENPRELFLIEGYTDAVGDESYNLLLSDRRAETVALALSEYFGVRPENIVVQGYGERFPIVPTLEAERLNRRVAVRRITGLIQPK